MHHGAGNHERCRQKPAVCRPLPHFCAGRLPRGSLQEPEHGAEQLCHPGWAGNGPGTGGAGAGRRHRAGCADEPHPAQTQQRRGQSGHRERRGAGPDVRRRLFQNEKNAHPGDPLGLQQSGRNRGHRRHRRGRKPGGDQPEGGRYRQHGPCPAGGCPRSAGGRHRPGRCVRPAVRHGGAAGARGARPRQRAAHQ